MVLVVCSFSSEKVADKVEKCTWKVNQTEIVHRETEREREGEKVREKECKKSLTEGFFKRV